MFGSWLLGFVGALVFLAGLLLIAVGFISVGKDGGLGFIGGPILIALGSFMRYKSKHTVRVRP
jgi:hypothetical protein